MGDILTVDKFGIFQLCEKKVKSFWTKLCIGSGLLFLMDSSLEGVSNISQGQVIKKKSFICIYSKGLSA